MIVHKYGFQNLIQIDFSLLNLLGYNLISIFLSWGVIVVFFTWQQSYKYLAIIFILWSNFSTGPLCGFLLYNWVSYLVGEADSAISFKIVVRLNDGWQQR